MPAFDQSGSGIPQPSSCVMCAAQKPWLLHCSPSSDWAVQVNGSHCICNTLGVTSVVLSATEL